jgi:hypothetical protein
MKPVDQTILHDPESGAVGNCMQAALASILDMDLDDVPHFVQLYPDSKECGDAMFQWLLEGHVLWMQLSPEEPVPADMPCLLYGKSERGLSHVVVGRGRTIIHDPHPSRAGLTEIEGVWVMYRYEPI